MSSSKQKKYGTQKGGGGEVWKRKSTHLLIVKNFERIFYRIIFIFYVCFSLTNNTGRRGQQRQQRVVVHFSFVLFQFSLKN